MYRQVRPLGPNLGKESSLFEGEPRKRRNDENGKREKERLRWRMRWPPRYSRPGIILRNIAARPLPYYPLRQLRLDDPVAATTYARGVFVIRRVPSGVNFCRATSWRSPAPEYDARNRRVTMPSPRGARGYDTAVTPAVRTAKVSPPLPVSLKPFIHGSANRS